MEIARLSEILRESGIVGAGGAGFPTYGKLSDKADTILMNCAECEPLLKLHRQLLGTHAREIMQAFALIGETVGAKEMIIGIKKEYKGTIAALHQYIDEFPGMRIHELPGAYPMGDEVVLIYEATGRVVRPGGLPIECGVAVFNVETLWNVYRAVWEQRPVTEKYVTVVGEVEHPVTVSGAGGKFSSARYGHGRQVRGLTRCICWAVHDGQFRQPDQPVTKTTNAIIVLSRNHPLVLKKQSRFSIDVARAASICCQCQTCTDLCPRYNLGHPIRAPSVYAGGCKPGFPGSGTVSGHHVLLLLRPLRTLQLSPGTGAAEHDYRVQERVEEGRRQGAGALIASRSAVPGLSPGAGGASGKSSGTGEVQCAGAAG